MFRLIFIILVLINFILAKEYITVKNGVGKDDNNKKACCKAYENARRNALNEAQVFVYSEFESSKESVNGKLISKVKKNLNIHSYGKVELLEKISQNLTLNQQTYESTCKIRAKFLVDTTPMKDEVNRNIKLIELEQEKELALSEAKRLKAINEKAEQEKISKEKKLLEKLKQIKTIKENISIVCDDTIPIKSCRQKLNKKVKLSINRALSKKYQLSINKIFVTQAYFLGEPKIENIEGGYRYRYDGMFKINLYFLPSKQISKSKKDVELKGIVKIENLMWQNNQPFKTKYNFADANKYCSNLKLWAYKDWRLPTKDEFKTIFSQKANKYKGEFYYIKKDFLKNIPTYYPWFWTSTKLNDTFVWNKNFGYGIDSWFLKSIKFYVMCVRGNKID